MKVRHRCISVDAATDWQVALHGIRHGFAHTRDNCRAMQLTSHLETYLYYFEAGNTRIACPISVRQFGVYRDIFTPYGLSGFVGTGDFSDFPHYWNEFVRREGYVCGYIGLNPVFANTTYFKLDEAQPYNTIYVLDLTLGIDQIFANLSNNRKRQLKRPGCEIVIERRVLIDFFLNTYCDFVSRVNASAVYHFSMETLSFLLNLDNVLVVGARGQKNIEAVSVFAFTPYAADFLFNVSLPTGRHHSAVLLWYGATRLKSLNIPVLNLGGGIRNNDGVTEFKRRFGARELTLKCLKQVYEPDAYMKLCRHVNADPDDRSGYFPPWAQRPSKSYAKVIEAI
jgi:hypothetical protein